MKIAEYLAVPYILEAETVIREDGWTRRISYPELPNCVLEHESILEGLRLLDQLRIRTILNLVREHKPVPMPRSPLLSHDVKGELKRLGLLEEVQSEFPL